MQVTTVTTYAVKSLGGVDVERSDVGPRGLAHDRRWAVLDERGRVVTARERPAMLGITARPTSDGVRLEDGTSRCDVATPTADASTTPTGLSRLDRLTLADPAAGQWLTERLGVPVRLVFQADGQHRELGAHHGGRPGDGMALADAGPVLLVTRSSVDRLRDLVTEGQGEPWLDRTSATRRFRANVVVDGEEPFAEDDWRRVRIGGTTYRFGEHCDRCVMTTIDLDLLATTPEPIRTLARHRRWDGATWFGVRLVPESPGTVGVGDEVEVLARA